MERRFGMQHNRHNRTSQAFEKSGRPLPSGAKWIQEIAEQAVADHIALWLEVLRRTSTAAINGKDVARYTGQTDFGEKKSAFSRYMLRPILPEFP